MGVRGGEGGGAECMPRITSPQPSVVATPCPQFYPNLHGGGNHCHGSSCYSKRMVDW